MIALHARPLTTFSMLHAGPATFLACNVEKAGSGQACDKWLNTGMSRLNFVTVHVLLPLKTYMPKLYTITDKF